MKNTNSIKSIQQMARRGHAFVPRNLDMTQFGNNADKVAVILDWIYRDEIYASSNGYVELEQDLTKKVPINMERLTEILREPAAPIMDLICWSKRHEKKGTQPIEEVIERVKLWSSGRHSALYALSEKYQVKPKIHKFARSKNPVFKYDPAKEAERIANMPPSYQIVCKHVKSLTLEMDEKRCEEVIPQIQDKYIQKDRKQYIEEKTCKYREREPNISKEDAALKAAAQWEKRKDARIAELNEKYYERILFIRDKVLEMEGRDEMPIYGTCDQGRLHYYLTNMTKELHPYIRLNGCKIMAFDLKTSQPIFIWVLLGEYIREHNITLAVIKEQADEILDTIKLCGNGTVPEYIQESIDALKQNGNQKTIKKEMAQFRRLLEKDFYHDVMETLDWERLADGEFDRDKFKSKVLFPFLYGTKPSWNIQKNRKKMIQYFIKKFPALYCVLWKMRRFTEICLYYPSEIKGEEHLKEVKEYINETYLASEFPKEMQRREAQMFFNVIIPMINQPCVTIHDSILVEAGKKSDVSKIIKKAFKDIYRIKVKVTCKTWR